MTNRKEKNKPKPKTVYKRSFWGLHKWKFLAVIPIALIIAFTSVLIFHCKIFEEYRKTPVIRTESIDISEGYYIYIVDEVSSLEEFDYALFCEAMAVITLTNPDLKFTGLPIATLSVAERRGAGYGYEGNDLTYPQAYLFTKYLIENYSLDTVLSMCMSLDSYNFNQRFGKTYTEVFSNFLYDIK